MSNPHRWLSKSFPQGSYHLSFQMKEEVTTLRKTKCIRIYNTDNHYYFYICEMDLPCGFGKEAMKQAMGDKTMGVCWKGIGNTLVHRSQLVPPKYSVIFLVKSHASSSSSGSHWTRLVLARWIYWPINNKNTKLFIRYIFGVKQIIGLIKQPRLCYANVYIMRPGHVTYCAILSILTSPSVRKIETM